MQTLESVALEVKNLRSEVEVLKAQAQQIPALEFRRCSFCKRSGKELTLVSTPDGEKPVAYICEPCAVKCMELFNGRKDGAKQS